MSNLNFPFFISTLTNQKYNIISSEYKIGRNPLSVLPLIHPSVSKEHGELKYNSLTKQLSIRDLNSLNGIYINGKRIEKNIDVVLNNNDKVKFGKDNDIYIVNTIGIKENKEEELLKSNDFYRNEYKIIQNKYSELEKKYCEIQKEKETIEFEIQLKEEEIKKIKKCDNIKLLEQKDKVIEILQNELNIIKKNIPNYTSLNHEISDKILKKEALNDIKNTNLEMENKKLKLTLEELTKENQSLVDIINKLSEQNKNELEKHNMLILQYDNRINELIQNFPNKISSFNIQKEEAAKFLVEQVSSYIKEKETLLSENSRYNTTIKQLTIQNEQLKSELDNVNNTYQKEINDLHNEIEQLNNRNNYIPNTQIEKYLLDIQNSASQKDKQIELLQRKLNQYSNPSTFDQKEIVEKMSNELSLKDREIYNLRKNLPISN